MKTTLYSIKGEKKGTITIPPIFSEPIRNDLVKRSVMSIESKLRQPYGTSPEAGQKTSAKDVSRRSIYGSWANKGYASIRRIRVGSGHLTGRARTSPEAVKGRRAHPPMAEKIWVKEINKKENRIAIRSAIAATANKDLIIKRGHNIGAITEFPIIVENDLEDIKKTTEIIEILNKLGFTEDLKRTSERSVRAGKGTMRGRKYKTKKGVLIVVADDKNVKNAAENILGIDICKVKDINTKLLAPGKTPGRLTLWSKSAIDLLDKENLFY
ncbi:MAG: 50S ribosomal protein L4 [DPANN group archaeon]|nr:50S ribosomal protein L4 [DPANN group archaeon]